MSSYRFYCDTCKQHVAAGTKCACGCVNRLDETICSCTQCGCSFLLKDSGSFEDPDYELFWCSNDCYMEYYKTHCIICNESTVGNKEPRHWAYCHVCWDVRVTDAFADTRFHTDEQIHAEIANESLERTPISVVEAEYGGVLRRRETLRSGLKLAYKTHATSTSELKHNILTERCAFTKTVLIEILKNRIGGNNGTE